MNYLQVLQGDAVILFTLGGQYLNLFVEYLSKVTGIILFEHWPSFMQLWVCVSLIHDVTTYNFITILTGRA
jgi:hypothetical protein